MVAVRGAVGGMTMATGGASDASYVRYVTLVLGGFVALYVALHLFVPDHLPAPTSGCTKDLGWRCFAAIEPTGEVEILDPRIAEWYIGRAEFREVAWHLEANRVRIAELRVLIEEEVTTHISGLLIDRTPVKAMLALLAVGDYGAAEQQFQEILGSLSAFSRETIVRQIPRIELGLQTISGLRSSQEKLVESLAAPWPPSFVWMSPLFLIAEVLFWAIFGVLVHLLVRSLLPGRLAVSSTRLRGVAHAKLLYGPIVALLLFSILYEGWIRLGSYEMRAWFVPAVSFLLGYASHAFAQALDRFFDSAATIESEGQFSHSQRLPEAPIQDPASLPRPIDLDEMRSQLKGWVRDFSETQQTVGGLE